VEYEIEDGLFSIGGLQYFIIRFFLLRVVNFDSDEKSDQKIDIFSANQISGFLQ
jgi:hypothetical protein